MSKIQKESTMSTNNKVDGIELRSLENEDDRQISSSHADEENTVDTAPGLDMQQEGRQRQRQKRLPPVDGGWAAWSYLAAATGLEVLVWGFANSYGVFLDYYTPRFPNSNSLLSIVGTVALGSMYLLLAPLTLWLTAQPRFRPHTMWAGLVIMTVGFIGAAFAKSAAALVITQGVLYGVGGTMLYCPTTSYMFEWWLNRRGFASGIMLAGTGAGGLVMPLISSALLQRYGQRTTLLSIGIGYAILLALLIPFIRPRLPLSKPTATRSPKIDWGFLGHVPFWLLWIGVLCQGLAAFIPSTYLPLYATALSLRPAIGTLSIAMLNLGRVPGQVLLGYLADKLDARLLIIFMAVASSVSVFAGWGAATNPGGLIAFSLVFGGFAGSYTALFSRFIRVFTHDDPHLPAVLYALFFLARGIGSIASGPLSTALMSSSATTMGGAKGGYGVGGGDFGVIILWTGAAMVASGVGAGYKGFKLD